MHFFQQSQCQVGGDQYIAGHKSWEGLVPHGPYG